MTPVIVRRVLPVLAAAVAAMATAVLGVLMTDLGDWYRTLKVPPWKPPDEVFGPAWGVIFMLNGLLNALWSGLFFRMQRPDLAGYEVVFLWASIIWLILHVRRASPPAARLLYVYLAWVTFAGALTWSVARLNGPFG
jgi:tryptophan-rich sensory protein